MDDSRNQYQIIRKDARNCFVESLSDAFAIGKIHLVFASYDLNRPSGQRQTDNVHIYINASEFLELCMKLLSGELRWMLQSRKNNEDNTPLLQWLGGTSAERLAKYGRSRPDGKCLSRTAKLLCGKKSDFLLVADSGPGEQNDKGLIVPKFGTHPENHVSVSLSWDALNQLLLTTKAHYQAWLTAYYVRKTKADSAMENERNGENYV